MPNKKRHNETVTIICEGCGEPAVVLAYYEFTRKYCSNTCASKTNVAKRFPDRPPHCTVEGCEKPVFSHGLCQKHNWRKKHYGDVGYRRWQQHCNVEGCERPHAKGGYCSMHIQRVRRYGSPELPVRSLAPKRYRIIHKPEHPLAMRNGRVFEHRAVLYDKIGPGGFPCHWCGKLVYWGRSYPKDDDALVVDHLDHDRHNNDPSNLVPSCNTCNGNRHHFRRGHFTQSA